MKNIKTVSVMHSMVVIIIAGVIFSCSDDPAACELGNTGTMVVENSHNNGNLQVHFNKAKVAANSLGDLSLMPGEQGSMELPAGQHNIKAILVITDCSGSRCQVSTSLQNDSDEDLSQCETRNFVF